MVRDGNHGVGDRVRSARKRLGLSQRELGSGAGLSVPFISYIETGKREPSLSSLMRLADVLGVSADELLGRGRGRGRAANGATKNGRGKKS